MNAASRPGRRGAILAGVGLVGIIGAAGAYLPGFGVLYHLMRLERDPSRFLQVVSAPDGSPRAEAARRFVTREEGKAALLRAFLAHMKELSRASGGGKIIPDPCDHTAFVSEGKLTIAGWDQAGTGEAHELRASSWVYPREVRIDLHEVHGVGAGPLALQGILRLLPALVGGEHTLPEESGVRYAFERKEQDGGEQASAGANAVTYVIHVRK